MEEARITTPTAPGRGLRKLASPNWPVVGILVALFVGLFVFSWLVARNEESLPDQSLDTGFTALWQVQTGIATIALPVLIFIIELSKDQEQAALRSPDVLIRSSAVLPISVFALLGVLRIGHDILWFETGSTFRIDFLFVLLPTVALAIYAYVSTLRLLFNASMFKSRAIDVAKEKMTNSLDASIEIRIANNILVQRLNEWGADLWILGEEESEGFKETARWNVRARQRDTRMEVEVVKTVTAFLNGQGGTLLIGVEDSGRPVGLDVKTKEVVHPGPPGRLALPNDQLPKEGPGEDPR